MNEINLKAEYHPEVDMFVIKLPGGGAQVAGHQAGDPDVVMHKDAEQRVVEIEIENAAKRLPARLLREDEASLSEEGSPLRGVAERVASVASEPTSAQSRQIGDKV